MNLVRIVLVFCLAACCLMSGCTRSDTTLTVYSRLYPEEVEIIPIEGDYNVIAPIEIGVLSFSEHPELSMKLARYLASSQGEKVFARHGYTTSSEKI
jgi:ABC-type molybdate transport system substrate-binding protein